MALEDILRKIGEKNQKDIEHIEKEANEKCKTIEKEITKEVKELKARNMRQIQTDAEKLKEHMLQEARIKKAKGILETKSDILEDVFKEALKKLGNLSAEKHLSWIEKMILKVVEPGENEIILPKKLLETNNIEKFLKSVNEKLKGKSHIKLSKDITDIIGGFVLKRPKREINCSFTSLLEEKRNSLKIKISQLLFGNALS